MQVILHKKKLREQSIENRQRSSSATARTRTNNNFNKSQNYLLLQDWKFWITRHDYVEEKTETETEKKERLSFLIFSGLQYSEWIRNQTIKVIQW